MFRRFMNSPKWETADRIGNLVFEILVWAILFMLAIAIIRYLPLIYRELRWANEHPQVVYVKQ